MAGEALGPVLDDFEFDATAALTPHAINLDGEYYAVVYRQGSASAWIKTYRIIADGTISEIDTWEFSVENATNPMIFSIAGDLYAITYHFFNGSYNRGQLKTIHISDTGTITESFDDAYQIANAKYPGYLMQITGNYFVLINGASPNDHYVYTFTLVSGAGGITLIDSYDYLNLGYFVLAAGKVTDNVFFAAFACDASYYIYTLHVSNTGVITSPYVAVQAFAVTCGHSRLRSCEIAPNIFAIVGYDSGTFETFIHTIQINNDGTIGATTIDTLVFTGIVSYANSIAYTGTPGRFFIAYADTDTDGKVDVIDITNAGAISDDPLYTAFEFDDNYGAYPSVLPLNGALFPIFYIGPDGDGWIKTVTFAVPAIGVHHEMIMKIGP